MSIFDEALETLGRLANEVYDDQQLDNKIGAAIETTAGALQDLRQRVGRFLDQFETDGPPAPDDGPDRVATLETKVEGLADNLTGAVLPALERRLEALEGNEGPQVPDHVLERLDALEAAATTPSSTSSSKSSKATTKEKTS